MAHTRLSDALPCAYGKYGSVTGGAGAAGAGASTTRATLRSWDSRCASRQPTTMNMISATQNTTPYTTSAISVIVVVQVHAAAGTDALRTRALVDVLGPDVDICFLF